MAQLPAIVQVPVVKEGLLTRNVGIAVDMINPLGVESARSPDQPVDVVSLFNENLGKVTAILAGDAGNQCAFQLKPSLIWLVWLIWFILKA
jgi:hypothetical protein